MTVCIAAIADYAGGDRCIVTVSDELIGGEHGSSETSVKVERFWKDWSVMLSASDIGQASTIIEMAREAFRDDPEMKNSVSAVRATFKEAYRRRLAEVAGDRILSAFGLDMERFIETGRETFTEQMFNVLSDEIRKIFLGCEFLVYGFDADNHAHIFKVAEYAGTGPEDQDCGRPGFAVIGNGIRPAEMILYALEQNIDLPMVDTIYNVCAAKFMAERVSGVGKYTFLYVKKPGSTAFQRSASMLHEIRAAWEKDGAPRLPPGILDKIRESRLEFL